MATVYLARSVGPGGIQRLVALKVMHPFLSNDREFVEMFLDEARVAARIRHPNVVSNVDLGTDHEHLFMVMDYVEGDTLAAVQSAAARLGRAIPLGVVLRIVLDALAGLEAAHTLTTADDVDLKVVHRDVSPQNIIVGVDGVSRLTDFGIARAEQRIATTRAGMLKGKVPFMAPEQLEGRPLDRRADVFAMGVTLWEAIALRKLFPSRDGVPIPMRKAPSPYRSLKDVLPSVPDGLDAIVSTAVAYNPADRYPTAAAFADALESAFRPLIASQRNVGAFMALVAAKKIQRERDAVRNAPRPVEEPPVSLPSPSPHEDFARHAPEGPISPAAARAFETRPPTARHSTPPGRDTCADSLTAPAPITVPYEVVEGRRSSAAVIANTMSPGAARLSRWPHTAPGVGAAEALCDTRVMLPSKRHLRSVPPPAPVLSIPPDSASHQRVSRTSARPRSSAPNPRYRALTFDEADVITTESRDHEACASTPERALDARRRADTVRLSTMKSFLRGRGGVLITLSVAIFVMLGMLLGVALIAGANAV